MHAVSVEYYNDRTATRSAGAIDDGGCCCKEASNATVSRKGAAGCHSKIGGLVQLLERRGNVALLTTSGAS